MIKKYDYLNRIIDHIEKSLTGEVNLDEIAKLGAVSLMQLYRDFYAYTGHSIKEYIRKRRLSNACALIKHTNIPLVEIALTNGYETQQSFNKQFKTVLGVTPLEYKNGDIYFSFYPFSHGNISTPVKVTTETIPITICCKYYSHKMKGIENKAVSALLDVIKCNSNLYSDKFRLFGRDGKQKGNRFCYELMVVTSGKIDFWLDAFSKNGFDEVSVVDQATSAFASCIVKDNEQAIVDGWNYLYNSWLNISMFEPDDRDYFEEYCLKGLQQNKLKLYLPVRKKSNYRTINLEEMPAMTFLINRKTGPGAEEAASKSVIGFLSSTYPYILKEAATFYLSCYDSTYECGVKLDNEIALSDSSEVEIIKYPEGLYARINDNCCGDISIYSGQLIQWLVQNGFSQDKHKVFALYEIVNGSFEVSNIKMTIYTHVKLLKKDNTAKICSDIVKEKTGSVDDEYCQKEYSGAHPGKL